MSDNKKRFDLLAQALGVTSVFVDEEDGELYIQMVEGTGDNVFGHSLKFDFTSNPHEVQENIIRVLPELLRRMKHDRARIAAKVNPISE